MKGFDDLDGPSLSDLDDIDEEAEAHDFEGDFLGVPLPPHSSVFDRNQRDYMDTSQTPHTPDVDDDSPEARRARMHARARDQSAIDHEIAWATISKGGSFLGPKEFRDKESKRR